MLGCRGHFASKSRTYSTTFAALRAERQDWLAAQQNTTALADLDLDAGTILVVNDWRYLGRAVGIPDRGSPPTIQSRSSDMDFRVNGGDLW